MIARPTPLGATLTALGAAVSTWGLLSEPRPAWALALGFLAVTAWLLMTALAVLPGRLAAGAARGSALSALAIGAFAGPATEANSIIPAAVCAMVLLADDAVSLAQTVAIAGAGLGLVAVGAVLWTTPAPSLAGMLGAIVVGVLAGLSRRQSARSRRREALLEQRERALREEAGRNALARDLHDVLAHTLGGLVVQLDAAEALLEAGEAPSAHIRVTAARELAATGLGEARRAVAALRRPPESETTAGRGTTETAPIPPHELDRRLDELVAMHRALGGEIAWERSGEAVPLDPAEASTLQRALQEALSNARRHAPGSPVVADLRWRPGAVRLTVTNPHAAGVTAPSDGGSGFGLQGMRERVRELPHGGTVTVEREAGSFVLTVEEVLT